MAKYTASPHYSIVGEIDFGVSGVYETEDVDEIVQLDSLVPTWIKRIDTQEPEVTKEDEKVAETDAKPAPRTRKATSAK
ncbi:hypothetical protein [Paenibacillus sp. FSL K6-2859]|uniref:hypothetical protein n=1 Tax=Paenibacillus sp. FSL K6-2859 TaxID=2921482 RepID=UPI0030F643FA